MPRVRDTVLLSGWLFADLLLALAVLFMVADNSTIRFQAVPPPVLQANTTQLNVNQSTSSCQGRFDALRCSVTISEAASSQGNVIWSVDNDLDQTKHAISYAPSQGTLSPGQSTTITMSGIPCENSVFTFRATRTSDNVLAVPAVVSFRCKQRLDFTHQSFTLTLNDVNAFLNGNSQDDDVKQQIQSQPILQGRSVGLAIVYGGAPDTGSIGQAQRVASKVYRLLGDLGKTDPVFQQASYYVPLYTLGGQQNQISVDVYFFITR